MRWRLRLREFDYEIIYLLRRMHQVPDALSRMRIPGKEEDEEVDYDIPTNEEKPLPIENSPAQSIV